ALLLALAVAGCYANSLGGAFLLDDPRPGEPLSFATRPLTFATFALNRAIGAEALWNYHVFNALLHLACGLALLGVLRRATALAVPTLSVSTRDGLALATSLLWLCHPLQTETITYLSQRAEALATLFYLSFAYAFLRSVDSSRPRAWQALALVPLACGLATKEIMATAPAFVWLFDAAFLAGGPLRALRRRRAFYAGVAGTALVVGLVYTVPEILRIRGTAGVRMEEFGPLEYARTQPAVILHYLRLVFWPYPQCFDYGWPIAPAGGERLSATRLFSAVVAAAAGVFAEPALRRLARP